MRSLRLGLCGQLATFALCHWTIPANAVQVEPSEPTQPATNTPETATRTSALPLSAKAPHTSNSEQPEAKTEGENVTAPPEADAPAQPSEDSTAPETAIPLEAPESAKPAETSVSVEASGGVPLSDSSSTSVNTSTESRPEAKPRRATARPPMGPGSRRRTTYSESPQNFAMELRLGPYFPDIDAGSGRTAQNDFFGNKPRLQFGMELDWQALRLPYVGSLGAGASVGYLAFSGDNRLPSGQQNVTGQSISQESTLTIVPISLVAVLRLDEPARRWPFPLVPYGKVGLGYALWSVHDGIGIARSEDGESGRGRSSGFHAAVGAMFLLDFVEPSAARFLDTESGINNSYVFFEWTHSNLGGNDGMNVGDDGTWVTGIALEM